MARTEDKVMRINARLIEERKSHPSIILMRGSVDEELLPRISNADRFAAIDDEDSKSLKDVFRESWTEGQRHLFITGPGGVGKTVALLTFATEDGFLPERIPTIYIPLHTLAHHSSGDAEFCIDSYLEKYFRRDPKLVDEIDSLSRAEWRFGPNFILLLDGYNEIPSDKRINVEKGIRKWASRPGVQIVTTSRVPGLNLDNTWQLELQKLDRKTAKKHLEQCGVTPPDNENSIWELLETPLMLRLYADVAEFRDQLESEDYIQLEDSDSAGHLVWNYLQRDLYGIIKDHRGSYTKAEYAAALLLALPYVCCRMESAHEFEMSKGSLRECVREACRFWQGQERPDRFSEVEECLESWLDDTAELAKFCGAQRTILTEETGLLVKKGDGYALLHQNFRDGLAALHLRNVMEVARNQLPPEFRASISEYVKDYLADLCDSDESEQNPLMAIWELNRKESSTDATATHNLLRVIHRRFDGDLSMLNWAGMDLRGESLFPYREIDGTTLKLARKTSARFSGTHIEKHCFKPQGHNRDVNSVCFSPEGDMLASGSDDGTIRLWDPATGRLVRELYEHEVSVLSVCFSPSGELLASGSSDGIVRLWDSVTGRQARKLEGGGGGASSVCFSPGGNLLAGGFSDGTVRLWDRMTGRLVRELDGSYDDVKSVHFLGWKRISAGRRPATRPAILRGAWA